MVESFQEVAAPDEQNGRAVPAVDHPVLASALAAMTSRTLAPKVRLFVEGDEAASLYLVRSGTIKLTRATSASRSTLLALLGPGELVGELSLLDGQQRGATAVTVTEAEVLELSAAAFDHWLAEEPGAAGLLMRQLARRMRRSNDAVSDLVFSDVPARVARTLLDLADRFATTDDRGRVVVRHELTQEELAQLVGAARETVNKTLATFAARGWIELDRRSFTVVAPEHLARRVS